MSKVAGEFVVLQGKQVVFSSKNESLCESKKRQLEMDSLTRGVDISIPEHEVKIGQTMVDTDDKDFCEIKLM